MKNFLKILVVNDDSLSRDIIISNIKKLTNPIFYSLDILEAKDGIECLEVLSHHHPDLIILNYQMPEMDGLETLKQIRTSIQPEKRSISVVFESGCARDHSCFVDALALGADDFVCSPIPFRKMYFILSKYFPQLKK